MHNRTRIRNALAAAFAGVSFPVDIEARHRISGDRPRAALSLTDVAEESGARAMGGVTYKVEHEQSCLIELHAEGATGLVVAEAIDAMELEIEQALAADLSLGGACELVEPVESTLETSVDGDRVVGVRGCTYLISWRALFGQPDTPET